MTDLKDPDSKSRSSAQRAVQELRHMIFVGELPAGSDHLESELAERLQMSRTPIHEAALTLEAQGLLEVRPRKGVRILPVSAADMREIYEILTELESLSAEKAAKAGYSDADLQPLADTIEAMDAALAQNDLRAWADADDEFHTELVRLGGNSRINAVVAMMADQVRRARGSTLFIRPWPSKSNEDHRGVLEAIRSGNARAARQIHHAHRADAKEMLTELLERHQLRNL